MMAMTSNRLLLTLSGLLITSLGFSQANLLNAKTPDEIGVKTEEQIKYHNDHPLYRPHFRHSGSS